VFGEAEKNYILI